MLPSGRIFSSGAGTRRLNEKGFNGVRRMKGECGSMSYDFVLDGSVDFSLDLGVPGVRWYRVVFSAPAIITRPQDRCATVCPDFLRNLGSPS